jgi:hypothetical protein
MTWSTFGCLQANDNAVYVAGAPPYHEGVVRSEDGAKEYELLLPDGIAAPDDVDKHIFVLDPAQDLVVETWLAYVEDGNVIAPWVLSGKLSDSGVGTPTESCSHRGTRAYGGSGIAGLIRKGELKNGVHHAIALKAPGTVFNVNSPQGNKDGWIWPATCSDGGDQYGSQTGNVFMGSLLAIPPDADLSDITDPLVMNLAVALQTYGGYIVDRGSDISDTAEQDFCGCISFLTEFNDPDALTVHDDGEAPRGDQSEPGAARRRRPARARLLPPALCRVTDRRGPGPPRRAISASIYSRREPRREDGAASWSVTGTPSRRRSRSSRRSTRPHKPSRARNRCS